MRIYKENAIAITIDYQERLMPVIQNYADILARAYILIESLRVLGVPNIVTRQYPKGIGDTVDVIKNITTQDPVYDKIEFSCYDNSDIKAAVDSYKKNSVILFGVEAHVCVLQTAIDLIDAGYSVIMVEDCIGSRKENDKKIALKRARQLGATVTTSESILFELTRKARTHEFKAISKLIK